MFQAASTAWDEFPIVDLAQVLLPLLTNGEVDSSRLVCRAWHSALTQLVRTVQVSLSHASSLRVLPWADFARRFLFMNGLQLNVGSSCTAAELQDLFRQLLQSPVKDKLQRLSLETSAAGCLTPDWLLVAQLPNLSSFSIRESDSGSQATRLRTAAGLSALTGLTALTWLSASHLPNGFWTALPELRKLKVLCISHFGQHFNSSSLVPNSYQPAAALASLPQLEHLTIHHIHSNLPLQCVQTMLHIPTLHSINWGLQSTEHALLLCGSGTSASQDHEAQQAARRPHGDGLELHALQPSLQEGSLSMTTPAGAPTRPPQLTSLQLRLVWPATQHISYLSHSSCALQRLTLQHMSLDCHSIATLATLTSLQELHLLRFIPMHEPHMQGHLSRLSTLTRLQRATLATDPESFFSMMRFKFPNLQPDFSTAALRTLAGSWRCLQSLHLEMELGNFSGDLVTVLSRFGALEALTLRVVPVVRQVQAFWRGAGVGSAASVNGHHLAVTLPDLPTQLTSLHLGGVVLLPIAMQQAVDLAQVVEPTTPPAAPRPHNAIDYLCPLGEFDALTRPSAADLSFSASAECATQLVRLHLECCCVDDEVLELLCNNAKRLQHLSLVNNRGLTRAAMPCLGRLRLLQELHVSDNPSMLTYDPHDIMGGCVKYGLQVDMPSLSAVRWLRNLTKLSWTVEDAVCNVLDAMEPLAMLTGLQHLHLSCVWNRPKAELQRTFQQLVCLQLPSCTNVELSDVVVPEAAADMLVLAKKRAMASRATSRKTDRQCTPDSPLRMLRPSSSSSPSSSPRGGLMKKFSRTLMGLRSHS